MKSTLKLKPRRPSINNNQAEGLTLTMKGTFGTKNQEVVFGGESEQLIRESVKGSKVIDWHWFQTPVAALLVSTLSTAIDLFARLGSFSVFLWRLKNFFF